MAARAFAISSKPREDQPRPVPHDSAGSATALITARDDGPKVIVLTTFDLDDYAYAALRAGASGFLLKDASAADVIAAIRAAHSGDAVIAPSTTRRLLDHLGRGEPRQRRRRGRRAHRP